VTAVATLIENAAMAAATTKMLTRQRRTWTLSNPYRPSSSQILIGTAPTDEAGGKAKTETELAPISVTASTYR